MKYLKESFHLTDDGRAKKAGYVMPLNAILVPFVQNLKSLQNVDYFIQNVDLSYKYMLFSIDVNEIHFADLLLRTARQASS